MQREVIEFVLERIHRGWQIEAHACDKSENLLVTMADRYPEGFQAVPDKELIAGIREKCKLKEFPVIYMEEDMVYYMAFLGEDECLYLMGPVATEDLNFSQNHAYRLRHGITEQKYRIPYLPPVRALTGLSLAYYMITGKMVTEKELMQENEEVKKIQEHEHLIYQIRQDSEENRRFSYRDEKRWLAQIQNGTLQPRLTRIDGENMQKLDRVGRLAVNNSFKQYEYMVISQICLASRAAMEGGMNTYEAYTLSDMYYQKVSKCTDVMELLNICLQVETDFSEQVRLAKQQNRKDNYIEQCKDYIARHRTKKFSVSEMAKELGINRSYLSRQFSARMGITIQEYALQQRLEAAANMLKYSEEQIKTIAEYLCFPSHSYFSECFRKQYGMTPEDYRKENRVIDFHDGHP